MAPTWASALPVGGVSIHSVFKLKPEWSNTPIQTLVKQFVRFVNKNSSSAFHGDVSSKLMLVFDEVSLMPVAMLVAIDKMLRAVTGVDKAFGDIQCVFIGDFHQLSPIFNSVLYGDDAKTYLSSYIFKANVLWRAVQDVVLMKTRFRCKDPELAFVLDSIESGVLRTDDDRLREVVDLLKPCVNRPDDGRPALQVTGNNDHVKQLNSRAEEVLLSTEGVAMPHATVLLGMWDGLESQAPQLHRELKKAMRLDKDSRMYVGQTVKLHVTLGPDLPKGLVGVITSIRPHKSSKPQSELREAGENAYAEAKLKALPKVHAAECNGVAEVVVQFGDKTEPVSIPYVVITARLDLTHSSDGKPVGVFTGDMNVPYAGLVCCPLVASAADTAHQVQGMTMSKVVVHLNKLWGYMLPMLIGRVQRLEDLVLVSHQPFEEISLTVWRRLLELHPDAQQFYEQLHHKGPMKVCKATVESVNKAGEGLWVKMKRASGREPKGDRGVMATATTKGEKKKKVCKKRKRGGGGRGAGVVVFEDGDDEPMTLS